MTGWTIRYDRAVVKGLAKLDRPTRDRIQDYMDDVARLRNPRSRGKALTANLAGLWRYRVGDYRIVCDIEDGELVVLVVDVAHRSRVYKRS